MSKIGLEVACLLKYNSLKIFLTLTVCSYHVTYAFQSESTLYCCQGTPECPGCQGTPCSKQARNLKFK